MTEKIVGIVIDVIRHSDTSNVVVVYTRDRGRIVLLSPVAASKGRTSRNARLMPLAVISADIRFTAGREMHRLGAFSLVMPWRDLYLNPVKITLGIFLREFLSKLLHDSPPDAALWDYIVQSLGGIDAATCGIADLHLRMLSGLLPYVGIQPDLSGWQPGAWFDMRGGNYSVLPPLHSDVLKGEESLMPLVWNAYADDEKPDFSSLSRHEALQGLLKYYAIHFPGMNGMKSPEILSAVFRD